MEVAEHPVRLLVTDDLKRSRLTVFFRSFTAIPHQIVLAVYALFAFLVVCANWAATLVTGRPPARLHRYLVRFLRYLTHVSAYSLLLANPFPDFPARKRYPIDLELEGPARQRRLGVALRLLLAVPALVLATVFGTLVSAVSFLGWFVCVILGRIPRGMQDLGAYCLRYELQTVAYLAILTGRYPGLASAEVHAPLTDALRVAEHAQLVGRSLSSVEFVEGGEVRLRFDGSAVTVHGSPVVSIGGRSVGVGQPGYRDVLCERIGSVVGGARSADQEVVLELGDGSSLVLSRRP